MARVENRHSRVERVVMCTGIMSLAFKLTCTPDPVSCLIVSLPLSSPESPSNCLLPIIQNHQVGPFKPSHSYRAVICITVTLARAVLISAHAAYARKSVCVSMWLSERKDREIARLGELKKGKQAKGCQAVLEGTCGRAWVTWMPLFARSHIPYCQTKHLIELHNRNYWQAAMAYKT